MAPNPNFMLSRATVEDMREVVELEYNTFTDPVIRKMFMYPDTATGHAALLEQRIAAVTTNPHDYWIKIIDAASGRLVAVSNWRIFVGVVPEWKVEHRHDLFLEGDALDEARQRAENGVRNRNMLYTESCIVLNICLTSPQYQRQGAGTMMLQWGCSLADHLFLPAWVSASAEGAGLYRAHGFQDFNVDGAGDAAGIKMRRQAKAASITAKEVVI